MYSFDGVETVAEMCETAISRGVKVLAITDHTEVLTSKGMDESERRRLRDHAAAIREAQAHYAGTLKLLYACELGQPQFNPTWADEMATYPFDMVIGSIHFGRGGVFGEGDVDLYDVTYTRENRDACILQYFADTKEMIRRGGFHTLGHLDYILRRMEGCFEGKPGYTLYRDEVDSRIVEEVRKGKAQFGDNGLIDSQDQVGGFPELEQIAIAPFDTDLDGMPDEWEIVNGLDYENKKDGAEYRLSQQYTNLEVYINSLVPAEAMQINPNKK
jgi:HisJ family histidinol phosphate phosphatase